ncbi:hypothetical protein Hdeb2414_s0010g00347411 [Helianthus debilis subsp. tardiflorus]
MNAIWFRWFQYNRKPRVPYKEKDEEYNSALKAFDESPQFGKWLVNPL